jgi:hypothetical protein
MIPKLAQKFSIAQKVTTHPLVKKALIPKWDSTPNDNDMRNATLKKKKKNPKIYSPNDVS